MQSGYTVFRLDGRLHLPLFNLRTHVITVSQGWSHVSHWSRVHLIGMVYGLIRQFTLDLWRAPFNQADFIDGRSASGQRQHFV